MILIPAWVIALLTAMVALDTFIRYRRERNLLLLGKVLAWSFAAVIYALISMGAFDIESARTWSRWAVTGLPMNELIYRYAKIHWKI